MVSVFMCISSLRVEWRGQVETLFVHVVSLFSCKFVYVARGDRKTACNRTGDEWIVERDCRPPGPRIAGAGFRPAASTQGHLRALSRFYTPLHHQKTRRASVRPIPIRASRPAVASSEIRSVPLASGRAAVQLRAFHQRKFSPRCLLGVLTLFSLKSPPLSKYRCPYFANALPHSPAVTATRKSTQYTLGPSFEVYFAHLPTQPSVMRPERNSSTNSSSPMTTSGGSSFARSGMQYSSSTGTLTSNHH